MALGAATTRAVAACTFLSHGEALATETITVLFTDLVGSTELLSWVGEARADELRREHFGLLRAAIDDAGGREVKNLGDGLMVAFDGANAALDAAVAMQQGMTARPASAEPIAIRLRSLTATAGGYGYIEADSRAVLDRLGER